MTRPHESQHRPGKVCAHTRDGHRVAYDCAECGAGIAAVERGKWRWRHGDMTGDVPSGRAVRVRCPMCGADLTLDTEA